jgi:hypothetical protein
MAHTKEVRFIARNDYAAVVDGQEVGYAATHQAAMSIANEYVWNLIELENRYTEKAATVAAPVAVNPANITRQAVARVLVDARRKVADNRKIATALAKASTELEASRWYFTGTVLVIASRTTPGKMYRVTGQTCECLAHGRGITCWHKVAHRLLTRSAQLHVAA